MYNDANIKIPKIRRFYFENNANFEVSLHTALAPRHRMLEKLRARIPDRARALSRRPAG